MAEKKKASRTSSKHKQAGSGQKTLLDLFSKPLASANNSSEGIQPVIDGPRRNVDTAKGGAVRPLGQIPERADELRPLSQRNGQVAQSDTYTRGLRSKPSSSQKLTSSAPRDSKIPADDDIIDITDDYLVPGPSTRTTQRDAGRSIQAPLVSRNSPRPAATRMDSGSRCDPIILLDSSPAKPAKPPTGSNPAPKAVYSIFSKPKPARSGTHPVSPTKAGKSLKPPFPNSDSQHVRGSQSSFISPSLNFPRRAKSVSEADVSGFISEGQSSFRDTYHSDSSATELQRALPSTLPDRQSYTDSISAHHIHSHPAIQQVLDSLQPAAEASAGSSQQAWTDRWRPTRADQVLGNDRHALYLRDWLHALALQYHPVASEPLIPKGKSTSAAKKDSRGTKRPRVIRAVERKRGRKKLRIDSDEEEDSWIVNTDDELDEDEELELPSGSEDDEAEFLRQAVSRLDPMMDQPAGHAHPNSNGVDGSETAKFSHTPVVFHELKNTVLLAGPHGCGKTAAVYACAEELGWEVFEVYPGIGKRGGSSLNDLVGEVGKSHLVQKTRKDDNSTVRDAFVTLFGRGDKHKKEGERQGFTRGADGTEDQPLDIEYHDRRDNSRPSSLDNAAPSNEPSPDPDVIGDSKTAPKIRQSIVLLEEVDVVYKDDVNFWPSVINLIKDCKRPVVMTCNDITLVPVRDLPLQTVLEFEPCESSVAVSYLQSICLAEGCLVDGEALARLYETTYDLLPVDLHDSPVHPLTADLPKSDLRRTIHDLQFWCSSEGPIRHISDDLEDIADWTTSEGVTTLKVADAHESLRALRRLSAHTESVSFVDTYLLRKPMKTPQSLATMYSHEPSPDDEIGHPILFSSYENEDQLFGQKPLLKETLKQDDLVFYDKDASIATEAMRRSRGSLEAGGISFVRHASDEIGARALFLARVGYESQMLQVLTLVPVTGYLMPHPTVFLDYVPSITRMMDIDEALEEAHDETRVFSKKTRTTRNSQRTGYARQLMLSDEGREIVKATRLCNGL